MIGNNKSNRHGSSMTMATWQGESIQQWKYWHDKSFVTWYIYWFIISNSSGSIGLSVTGALAQMYLFTCQNQKIQERRYRYWLKRPFYFSVTASEKWSFIEACRENEYSLKHLIKNFSAWAFQAAYSFFTVHLFSYFVQYHILFKIREHVIMQ